MSRARSRSPLARPTTPLRTSSQTSFRNSRSNEYPKSTPLDALESQFAELSDSMADLEANFMHLQLMHESLGRFGESFASFLYGLNMNAFVVDFPEQPLTESIERWRERRNGQSAPESTTSLQQNSRTEPSDTTFMTNDTSFVSMKATPRRRTYGAPPPSQKIDNTTTTNSNTTKRSGIPASTRGGNPTRGTRGIGRAPRGSSLPTRGRGRGVR